MAAGNAPVVGSRGLQMTPALLTTAAAARNRAAEG
jgi:hypothetical protein